MPIRRKGEKYDYCHLNHIFARCSIDIFGGVETKVNFTCVGLKDSLNEKLFLYDLHTPVRSVTSQNTSEKLGKRQFGGICMIARGEVMDRVYETGLDISGLSCWSWI